MPNIEYIEIDFANQKIKVPKENIVVKLLEDISSTLKKPPQGQLSLHRFNGDKTASKNSKEYHLYNSLLNLELFLAGAEQGAIPETFIAGEEYNEQSKIIKRMLSLELENKNGITVIVGAVCFYICPFKKMAEIGYIEVEKNYQGNGYGSILFQAAMLISLLYGSKSITLGSMDDSYPLYVKHGFGLVKHQMRTLYALLSRHYSNPKNELKSTHLNNQIAVCNNILNKYASNARLKNQIEDTADMATFLEDLKKASQDTSKLCTQFEFNHAEKILTLHKKISFGDLSLAWNFNSELDLIPLINQIERFNPDFPFEQYVDLQVFNKNKHKRSGSDIIPEDVSVTKKIIVDSEEEDLAWINDVFDNTQLEPVAEHVSLGEKNMLYTPNVEQTLFSETRPFLCTSPDLSRPFSLENK